MNARRAVADFMRSSEEHRQFFRSCCFAGHFRLRSQAWQWERALVRQGYTFKLVEVDDALAVLAAELLPDSPAAGWDSAWASELMKNAYAYLGEFYIEDADTPDTSAITDAALAGDRLAYRAAIREFVIAGRRARCPGDEHLECDRGSRRAAGRGSQRGLRGGLSTGGTR